MVYLIGRYYDPANGQFLSVDPKVQKTKFAYVYAGDDPINNTDPTGLAIFSPPCHGTGSEAAACDLGVMAHTDFPGLSWQHIALIISGASLGALAFLAINRIPGGSIVLKLLGGTAVGSLSGSAAAAWAWNVGSPDVSQIQIDLRGAKLAVFVDKYEQQDKAIMGIGGGLNAFLDTKVAKDPQYRWFQAIALQEMYAYAGRRLVSGFISS
jgi:hypothetical protein